MDVSVAEAARRVGVASSTLRYWEREGLISPARVDGQRRYGDVDMRRAALLALARMLDLPLQVAVGVLDGTPVERGAQVLAEVERLERLIERARGAIELLQNAAQCTHARPASDCPEMRGALDRLLQGEDPRPTR